MDWINILLLGLRLLNRLTAWMERQGFIEQGIAIQVKANLEANDAILQNARKAYADSLARNPDGGVPRDIQDKNSRD